MTETVPPFTVTTHRTLPALLLRQAERFGERPFLTIPGARWRHRDAAQAATRCGAALGRAGVGRSDRVAVMSGNRVELLEVFLGCGWIGAASVPINTASMGPQIEYFLADSGARLLAIEAGFADRLGRVEIGRTALQAIWVIGDAAPIALPQQVPCTPFPTQAEATAPADVQPGETLAILYTSGTTGPAKGVICPHAQFDAWGANTARILRITEKDVLCTTLPLFHINALNTFAQAALTGSQVIFEPRFSASGFRPAMGSASATVVYLLGAMVPMLLTRTGWLQPGFEARIVDAHDAELPAGAAGELVLRADAPFAFSSGYFNRPEETVRAWRNLWFHTGERVVREADGAFRFIDRIKDAIRRRGENISSHEIEQVLLGHPAVAAAAVYPVGSELAEDEVMAALVARPGHAIDARALARFCAERLPRFAVPRYIDVVADLPRTESGKVQEYKLREQGVTATAWDRAERATDLLGTHPSTRLL